MKSHTTSKFNNLFRMLPTHIQKLARKNYLLWRDNPGHPGLDFKPVNKSRSAYSIRIGIGWRAVGAKKDDCIIWLWIGSHEEYNKLLKQFNKQ